MKRIQARNLTADYRGKYVKLPVEGTWHQLLTIEHAHSGTWLELDDPGYASAWLNFEYGDTLLEFRDEAP